MLHFGSTPYEVHCKHHSRKSTPSQRFLLMMPGSLAGETTRQQLNSPGVMTRGQLNLPRVATRTQRGRGPQGCGQG